MENKKIVNYSNDKSISEGYLAGGASLMVTILWMAFAPFHPLAIFTLFAISLFCFTLSTLWVLSKEKTIKEWFAVHYSRSIFVVMIEIVLIIVFFIGLNYLR
jgi:hypothetical protein